MRKVLDWCEFHADEPDSTEDEYEDDFERIRRVDICEWDREFLKVDYDMLFDIILAANYLDIKLRKSFLDLSFN